MEEILKDISQFVEECLGPLGGSGELSTWVRDFLIQLIATIILFLVVRIFLWKPITEFLEARKKNMDNELESAKEHNQKALEYEESMKEQNALAKKEIQKLLQEASLQGDLVKQEIIEEAKKEAERRIALANQEIELEIKQKEEDIKNQIVTIAFLAAEKIVGKEIDHNEYLSLVTNIIDGGLENE